MSRLDDLADQFEEHIAAPWQRNLAGAQRVTFVVYPREDERRLRIKVQDFENRALQAGRICVAVDLTNIFPKWLAHAEYKDEYFCNPWMLSLKLRTEFTDHCADRIRRALTEGENLENTTAAVYGVSALFGLTRLSQVVHRIEGNIRGRLVVFFPGTYEQNNYRLLDARDGWNYLATPIVSRI